VARTYQMDGDADAALDCLEAALAVAEAWGDEAAAGHAVNLQAIVHWQTGRLDDAERLYLLARTRALRAGDARLAAMTAQNLGVLANIRGDFEEAQRHYEASLAEYRTLGLTRDVAYGLNNLGLLHTACRQWDAAERALSESAQVCDLAGDVTTRIAVDVNLAELWVAQGEFARAQAAVARALDGAARTGDGASVGQATKLLGVCAREAGDFAGAEAHLAAPTSWPPRARRCSSRPRSPASAPTSRAASARTATCCSSSTARTGCSRSSAPAPSWPTSTGGSAGWRSSSCSSRGAGARASRPRTGTPRATASASPTSPAASPSTRARRTASTRRRCSGSASARCCTTWASWSSPARCSTSPGS
jgi:hypothetical protein